MTEQYSKSRQQAELSFSATQTQFFAKNNALEELSSINLARDEKTMRLRAARLAKEESDANLQTNSPRAKHKKAS